MHVYSSTLAHLEHTTEKGSPKTWIWVNYFSMGSTEYKIWGSGTAEVGVRALFWTFCQNLHVSQTTMWTKVLCSQPSSMIYSHLGGGGLVDFSQATLACPLLSYLLSSFGHLYWWEFIRVASDITRRHFKQTSWCSVPYNHSVPKAFELGVYWKCSHWN